MLERLIAAAECPTGVCAVPLGAHRTIRMETGSRDILPGAIFSSAGREKYLPLAPDSVMNVRSVSNGSVLILPPHYIGADNWALEAHRRLRGPSWAAPHVIWNMNNACQQWPRGAHNACAVECRN